MWVFVVVVENWWIGRFVFCYFLVVGIGCLVDLLVGIVGFGWKIDGGRWCGEGGDFFDIFCWMMDVYVGCWWNIVCILFVLVCVYGGGF